MSVSDFMLPCLNKKLFGLDCPGCGTQRAIKFLIEGEFEKAFVMFPAIYTTIFLVLFIGLHLIDKSRNYQRIIIGLAIANGLITIISYIYKLTNL